NVLLKELSKYNQIKNFEKTLNLFDNLSLKDDVLICFGKDHKDSLQISVIAKYSDSLIDIKATKNLISETITTNKITYTKTTINNQSYYSTIVDSLFFMTNVLSSITSDKKEKEVDLELEKIDRKSTRLNSSHVKISYAVFC